ncbi:MAG: hypothetical protein DWQ08_15305 [Proteobacteria bacterium]|nr:MAG: hypothetical protein DWQ08_15305 [Pseudomonadota bacterium]
MSVKKATGLAIATAAASMFAMTAPMSASASEDTVKCMGVNACKGMSSCKTASSSCKGLNSCKGQGFVAIGSKETCEQIGGTVG